MTDIHVARPGRLGRGLRIVVAAALVWAALGAEADPAGAAPKRVLFDNTHAETAGNADWVIDTDQPLPVPDQSTVTAATPRTWWLGAISSWGIDLVKRGFEVATLTSTYGITFGDAGNPYDLSNFDVFIVPEPNTAFTSAEAAAIFDFVAGGGGLIAVADHIGSDRNGDGIDSPQVWNALDPSHLFGTAFDTTGPNSNFTEVYSTNVSAAADDSIIHGPEGDVNGLEFHNGCTMTLFLAVNSTVRGVVWRNGLPQGTTGAMAARAVYGNGRVFFVGDSSPIDDGSASPGNSSIYDGWAEGSYGGSSAACWARGRTHSRGTASARTGRAPRPVSTSCTRAPAPPCASGAWSGSSSESEPLRPRAGSARRARPDRTPGSPQLAGPTAPDHSGLESDPPAS
jgi:hypothetical protein